MFEPDPTARKDLKAGTVYAVLGEQDWIYLGQVTSDKCIGFFRWRGREPRNYPEIAALPVMSVVTVEWPSITRALRNGAWRKLGRFELSDALAKPWPKVQWSVGTLQVTVFTEDWEYDAQVDDPAIQHIEIAASWDAEQHIPARLTADFGSETASWHIGGTVLRERRVKEEMAQRFPDAAWHRLPSDWIWTSGRQTNS